MISKVTIIIPTYNRSGFLYRSLKYYSSLKLPIKIIIADSSDDNYHKKQNIQASKNYKNILEITYFHSFNGMYTKLFEAVELSTTQFIVFCADKDFLVMEGLLKSVKYLYNNNNYSLARGKAINIINVTENIYFSNDIIFTSPIKGLSCEFDLPHLRLQNYLNQFYSTFYSVYKRDELIDSFLKIIQVDDRPLRLPELFLGCLTIIKGKAKEIGTLFHIRQSWKMSGAVYKKWKNEKLSKNFNNRYLEMENILVNEISNYGDLNKNQSEVIVKTSLDAYFSSASNSKYNLNFEENIAPNIIICSLKKIYLTIKEIKEVLYFIIDVGLSRKSIESFINNPFNTLKNIRYTKNQYWVNYLNRYEQINNYSINNLLKNNKYSDGFNIIHSLLNKYPTGIDN